MSDSNADTLVDEGRAPLGVSTKIAAWVIYAFLMAPLVVVIGMSFGSQYEYQFPPHSISLFLYRKFFSDPQWISALWLSVRVALAVTVLALAFGLSAAYALVRGEFPGKQLVMFILMSPILVPVVVIALGLYFYFARLHLIGSYAGLVAAHTIYTMPFVLVTAMAGLRHVNPSLEAAGAIMGAGRFSVFLHITLPILRPAIVVGALFAFLMSFDEVVIAFFILDATSFTLPVKMYGSIQFDNSPVLAAVSSLLTLMSVCVCALGAWLQRSR